MLTECPGSDFFQSMLFRSLRIVFSQLYPGFQLELRETTTDESHIMTKSNKMQRTTAKNKMNFGINFETRGFHRTEGGTKELKLLLLRLPGSSNYKLNTNKSNGILCQYCEIWSHFEEDKTHFIPDGSGVLQNHESIVTSTLLRRE